MHEHNVHEVLYVRQVLKVHNALHVRYVLNVKLKGPHVGLTPSGGSEDGAALDWDAGQLDRSDLIVEDEWFFQLANISADRRAPLWVLDRIFPALYWVLCSFFLGVRYTFQK